MITTHTKEIEVYDIVFDVSFEYQSAERGSQFEPGSDACVYINSIEVAGIELSEVLSKEVLSSIEDAALRSVEK